MDRVLRYCKSFQPQDENLQSDYTFTIIACAIGWQSGLVFLSEAGYRLDEALKLTIFRGDLNSLQSIISSESYLPNSCLGFTLFQDYYRNSICVGECNPFIFNQNYSSLQQDIMQHIVNAIKSRRERLLSLALSKLHETAVQALHLGSLRMLDTEASVVAEMLGKNGIKLPKCLNPGKTSIFNSFDLNYSEGGIQLANILYDTGFTDVEAPDDKGMTPLQRLVIKTHVEGWSGPDGLAIRWLIEHGADVNRRFDSEKVPLILELASAYSRHKADLPYRRTLELQEETELTNPVRYGSALWDWTSDGSLRKLLPEGGIDSRNCCALGIVSTLSSRSAICPASDSDEEDGRGESKSSESDQGHDVSDPLSASGNDTSEESSEIEEEELWEYRDLLSVVAKHSTTLNDNCKCYCSTNGCLPIHTFPMLHKDTVKTSRQIQDDILSWIEDCNASEPQAKLYIEAACQLELFERLEMAHTCCRRNLSCNCAAVPQETRTELQAEDAMSKEHLDLIMIAFKRTMESRVAWPLWEFWNWWWKIVDVILPPLLPWERGLRYCRPDPQIPAFLISHLYNVSAKRSQRLLEMAGYKDMDFLDVAQKHLAEFLNDNQQETVQIGLPESSLFSLGSSTNNINPRKVERGKRRKSKARRTEMSRGRTFTIICCCHRGRLCI